MYGPSSFLEREYSIMVNGMASGVILSGFKSQLH